jgi:hypothetical protein
LLIVLEDLHVIATAQDVVHELLAAGAWAVDLTQHSVCHLQRMAAELVEGLWDHLRFWILSNFCELTIAIGLSHTSMLLRHKHLYRLFLIWGARNVRL